MEICYCKNSLQRLKVRFIVTLQSLLSQSSVMCPPYIISPKRYLKSSQGTWHNKKCLQSSKPSQTEGKTHPIVGFKVVVEHISADDKIPSVERIAFIPALNNYSMTKKFTFRRPEDQTSSAQLQQHGSSTVRRGCS